MVGQNQQSETELLGVRDLTLGNSLAGALGPRKIRHRWTGRSRSSPGRGDREGKLSEALTMLLSRVACTSYSILAKHAKYSVLWLSPYIW